ncbi:hypothetical protein V1264_017331 [Littorina saxatilis]
MDPKELEDRLAAAEALSSLGLPAAFMSSSASSEVNSASAVAPLSQKAAKPRGKGRAAKEKDEHGTGRQSKSRSTRGRGREKAAQDDRNTNMSPVNSAAGSDTLLSGVAQQATTPRTSNSRGMRGGRGRGRGSKQGTGLPTTAAMQGASMSASNKIPESVLQGVGETVPTTLCLPGLRNSSLLHTPNASVSFGAADRHHASNASVSFSAVDRHHASATFVPSTTSSIPHLVLGGSRVVVPSSSTFSSPVSQSSFSSSSPSSSAATISSGSVSQKFTPTSEQKPSFSRTPASDNLASMTNLASLNSLPSFSLGSTGLPNLPSIPNLPSLPSAIASLQLNTNGGLSVTTVTQHQDVSPGSQLSPHGRDSDEKSLPLKKRRIIDSSSSSSAPQPSPMSPVPPSPSVSSPAASGAPVLAVASTSAAALGDPASPPEVSSPSPVPPVSLLSQVLPPAMFMQLVSEINTAITPDEDGDVPLHIAVVHENEAMVKKLIQLMALAGQKVDRYNKQHQTPLHLAVKLMSLPSIQMLLEAGADPNLVDSVGLTSTHMSVQGRDIDCLEALLQWSKFTCDINNRNFEGLAPLHSAVINNDLEVATRLLEQGADINIMDGKSGRTALFHAAETNQKAAVELLLNRGADPEIANYAGVVPAMAAQGRSHTTVARLLARALDETGEEEKMVVDKEAKMEPGVKLVEADQRAVPLKIMISEENARESHLQEMGRAMTAKMAAQIQQHVASANGQGQSQGHALPTVGSAPAILQSSSASGRAQVVTSAPVRPAGQPASVIRTTALGGVKKAVHQMPGVVTKMTSGLPGSSPSVNVPRVVGLARRGSEATSDPVAMDARSEKGPSDRNQGGRVGRGRARTSATVVRRDSNSVEPLSAERLVGRDSNPSEAQKGGQAAASSGPVSEDYARAFLMQGLMKAFAEQNAGQQGAVNLPVLPGVLPLGLTVQAPQSPSDMSRHAPVPGVTRVTPLPMPTTSVVTSPAISSIGLASPSSTAVPSAAHSQPTRPLLILRSSSMDPGSADSPRMEVRHVTADALLALQRSSSNSVNQNLKSAPANFDQQVRSFLSARQGMPGGLGTGVPMEASRVPPVSNHVSRESLQLQSRSYGFSMDGDSDQPKDLSLKSKKKDANESYTLGSDSMSFKPDPLPVPLNIPTKRAASSGRNSEKKRKATSSQDSSKPAGGKVQKTKSSKSLQQADSLAVSERKPSVSPGLRGEGKVLTDDKTNIGEGCTISIRESGLIVSEPVLDSKSQIVEISRGISDSRHEGEGKSPALFQPVKLPSDVFQTKPVSLTMPPSTNQSPGRGGSVTSVQENMTAVSDKTILVKPGARDGGSDQNDNVSNKLPVLEKMLNDSGRRKAETGAVKSEMKGEAMEMD